MTTERVADAVGDLDHAHSLDQALQCDHGDRQ